MIGFAQPLWLLWTALLVVLLLAAILYGEVKRQEMLSVLANKKLLSALTANISMFRRWLKKILQLGAVICFGLALARPQVGYRWEEIKRKGIDILFAIDTSRSMLAQDVRPSRLERSKLAVIDFSRNFGGGRLGLVPFAGSAFLMCPLTLDADAFYESLESLDTEVIDRPGTDIGAAIREASQAFAKGSGDEKILVLITDGEDLEGDAVDAAKEVAEQGVKIYAVGVGTSSGELIPDFQQKNGVSFVKDESGNLVKSRLDEKVLRQIASLTGGSYYPLGPGGEGLESILRDNQHLMKELEIKESMRKVPLEQFQWPLLAGLILLLTESLLRESKGLKQRDKGVRRSTAGILKKAGTALIVGVLGLSGVQASVRDAEKSMKAERYSDAVSQYRDALKEEPEEAALLYNRGVAAYRAKDYEEASRAFEEAKKSRDLKIQEKAYYNLGNTQFRAGELTEQSKQEETIRQWEAALASYQGALALDKDDKDARFNHDLVQKRLEALKKNPPPPKDDKKEQNKDENKDQNKDQQNQQEQNQNGQSQPDKNGQDKKDQKDPSGQNQKPGDQSNKEKDSGDKQKPSDSSKQGKEEGKDQKEGDSGKKDPKESKPETGQGQEKDGESGKEGEAKGKPEQLQPGQMSKEDAKALLNAAKNGQKQLLLPITRGKDANKNNPNLKNW